MVRYSRRKEILGILEDTINFSALLVAIQALDDQPDDDEEVDFDMLEDFCLAWIAIQSQRYLGPCKPLEKPEEICFFLLNQLEESRFKQEFRMTRDSFQELCESIRNHYLFQNNSNNPQRPVEEQMMVTLKRLGLFGNGSSVGSLACFFRVDEGTIELFTKQCLVAILSLQQKVLCWPNENLRSISSQKFESVGFKGCVGLIDGTLIGLDGCPQVNGPNYFSQKGHYGIVTLVVCDKDRKIIYLYTGWPGCSHDQRLIDNSQIHTKKEKILFSWSVFTR